MDETGAARNDNDLEALKALQPDAPELERIGNVLDRFDILETIEFIGQELMRSRFLAFLLDPRQDLTTTGR